MPAIYAHFRLGEEVREELDGEEKQAVEAYPELFRIGTHGPDILFYYRPLTHNAVSGLGHRMHAEAGGVFFGRAAEILKDGLDRAAAAEKYAAEETAGISRGSVNDSATYPAAKKQGSDQRTGEGPYDMESHDMESYDTASLAYLYGFLCHFALDVCCHGYIGEYIEAHGVSHAKIESELDRELMVRDGFDPVSHSIVGHLVASDENARVIAGFYGKDLKSPGRSFSHIGLSEKKSKGKSKTDTLVRAETYEEKDRAASALQINEDPIPVITEREIKKALRSMIFYSGVLLAPSRPKRAGLNFGMNIIGATGFQDMMIGLTKDPRCEESTEDLIGRYAEAKQLALRLIRTYRRQFLTKEETPDEIYRYNFESVKL